MYIRRMNSLSIRYASSADATLIAELSRKTFFDTFAAANSEEDMDKFMNEQFSTEALMNEVRMNDGIFFLGCNGDQVEGYVRMREGEKRIEFGQEPSIEIARIYVNQSAIGKGMGTVLMEECIRLAIEKKRSILWLGVWEKNERAITFYSKQGFEKFGEHDFVLGDDVQTDCLMWKRLEQREG